MLLSRGYNVDVGIKKEIRSKRKDIQVIEIGIKNRHILIKNISINIESVALIIGSNTELFCGNSVSVFIITGEVK